MSYTTIATVRSLVDTDLTDAEITNIITWADDWTNKKIDAGAATPAFLANISSTYTIYRILLKDPDALKLGELSTDRSTSIKLLKDDLNDLVSMGGGGLAFTSAVETLS